MPHNAKAYEDVRVIFLGGGSSKQSTTATTAANSTAWIDFQGWGRALFLLVRLKGTGNITANTGVYVSTAATGTSPTAVSTLGATGAMTTLITAARGTILKPGAGHCVFSVSAHEVAGALASGRYLGLRYRKKTRADRVFGICILMDPKFGKAQMTAGINQGSATLTAP